uniref:Nudix hydrolase 22 n=1 Tax=Sphenodon punctatus TaxID=8508 RepID=A0A8D0GKR8_SPHPU
MMDSEISIMVQCPSPEGIAEGQVQAELSPWYDRLKVPGDRVQIEASWTARRQACPWLFDGAKFRLHSAQLDGGGLALRLGLTCYKDFMGTNCAAAAGQLQQRGREDAGDSQAYLAEPLGVGAMLHTADNMFVFLRRSLRVGEAPGKVDIPGGHPEPQVVAGGSASGGPVRHEDLPAEWVVKEIFSSVLREIQDEVNLPLATLSSPVLLGIARNKTSAGRASAEFYVSCSLTSEQVEQSYAVGGLEAHESTGIIFVSREDVLTLEQSGGLWRELCPSAKGAVKLYALGLHPPWDPCPKPYRFSRISLEQAEPWDLPGWQGPRMEAAAQTVHSACPALQRLQERIQMSVCPKHCPTPYVMALTNWVCTWGMMGSRSTARPTESSSLLGTPRACCPPATSREPCSFDPHGACCPWTDLPGARAQPLPSSSETPACLALSLDRLG